MKPCWNRSSPFPSQSGRQESNLPSTAYQTAASPLGFGPKVSALYGNRTRLTCSTDRLARQHHHRAKRVSGGSRTRLSDAAGRCLGCSATDTQARTEGVEPSACGLEPHCSPRSTSLKNPAAPAGIEPATLRLTTGRSPC